MAIRRWALLGMVVCFLGIIVNCGGGGGGGSSNTPGTADTSAPSTPAGLTAAADSSSSIALSWNASTDNVGVAGYKIFRGGTQIATSTTNTYTDVGLTASTSYTYAVVAYDVAGNNSAQSTSASATTLAASQADTTAPTIPANLTATSISAIQINLSWAASTDNIGVTGYEVWRGTTKITTTTLTSFSDVGLAASTTYTYTVTAYDAAGNTSSKSTSTTATTLAAPASTVTVSGDVTFDSVPASSTLGLVYTSTTQKPARGVVVEAINPSDAAILFTTSTDTAGHYSVAVTANTDIKIRIKAQLFKTGTPSWDFQVVDNTNGQALYVADSASFNSGTSNLSKTYNLTSGWSGPSYTSTRAAAPFAILDTVYKAISKITTADNTAHFPQLLINWSVNNIGTSGDQTVGQIGTSHYSSGDKQLWILGKSDNDTDEYDDHVIAHEWGHYFEFNFSRSDSPGGSHAQGDKLDPRIAFGEGFGNAFSGMATDDPNYVDTNGAAQGSVGPVMNLADSNGDPSSIGWYSEDSVQYILYALYKNLGFSPIYAVFTNQQKSTNSFTTIYSFIKHLKANNPASATTINNLLSAKNISTTFVDEWDSSGTETNNGGDPKALPVYTVLTVGASPVQVCGNDIFGINNKLMSRRFIVFDIASSGTYTLSISPATAGGEPNYSLYSSGKLLLASDNAISQVITASGTLTPGTYYAEIFDYRHLTESTATLGEVCFDVSIN